MFREQRRLVLRRASVVLLGNWLVASAPAQQQTAFSIQGELRDANGVLIAGDSVSLQFQLFDQLVGGVPLSPPVDRPNVPLARGRFATEVSFAPLNGIPGTLFNGRPLFVSITILQQPPNPPIILPNRIPLLATPLALGLSLPYLGQHVSLGAPLLQLNNTNDAGAAMGTAIVGSGLVGVQGNAVAPGTHGVIGVGPTGVEGQGTLLGVRGQAITTGVRGEAELDGVIGTASLDGSRGVNGQSTGLNGIGVIGTANAGGAATGVRGQSTAGTGVRGNGVPAGVDGTSTGALGDGVRGTATGLDGNGVRGVADNGALAWGVWGSSATGTGVRGSGGTVGVLGTGANSGVEGRCNTDLREGVRGTGSGTNGTGVRGVADAGPAAWGVWGSSDTGVGVRGDGGPRGVVGMGTAQGVDASATNPLSDGVRGESLGNNGTGVRGICNLGAVGWGVWGSSNMGTGVRGTGGPTGVSATGSVEGVRATATGAAGVGVKASGQGANSFGVLADGTWGGVDSLGVFYGTRGWATAFHGVIGVSRAGNVVTPAGLYPGGVWGDSLLGNGVIGTSGAFKGIGVVGVCNNFTGTGTVGLSDFGVGASGYSRTRVGVYGQCAAPTPPALTAGLSAPGAWGDSLVGNGTLGTTTAFRGAGVIGISGNAVGAGIAGRGYNGSLAGEFTGNVNVLGTLTAALKLFEIDHPLDPENKVLTHACVESDQVLNVYSGNVVTDARGEAVVELPAYVEAVCGDFRYQLTVVGQFAQAIVGQKLAKGQFTIRTDKPNVEVSWQITGVRHDPYVAKNPLVAERMKDESQRGRYLHPDAFGFGEDRRILLAGASADGTGPTAPELPPRQSDEPWPDLMGPQPPSAATAGEEHKKAEREKLERVAPPRPDDTAKRAAPRPPTQIDKPDAPETPN